MNWKLLLNDLILKKKWDESIQLMKKVIAENPKDLEAYININYLLMNILVEEEYSAEQQVDYSNSLKKYFLESYSKFSNNPEYLFYTGITAFISEWYLDIDIEDARKMILNAVNIEPENIIYKWGYYTYLDMSNIENNQKSLQYSLIIIDNNNPYKKILESKGPVGKYILNIMIFAANATDLNL